MINQISATPTTEQRIDAIMEQAQLFASAWSFLGGPFDNGSGMETAEREKAALRTMLSKLRAEGVQAVQPIADAVERQCPRCTGNGTILRLSGNGPNAYDVQEECPHCEGSGVVASAPVAAALPRLRSPMCRISGVNEGVLRRAAMRHRAMEELQDPSALAALADGLESVVGNENAELAAAYFRREADRMASAPVAGEAQPVAWRALWTLPTPGVTAWHDTRKVAPPDEAEMRAKGYSLELAFAAPQASVAVRILFPAHPRKMWSGGEVQAWLDNQQGITPPTASAKGSLEHYRKWQAEPSEADRDGAPSKSPDQLRGCAWSDS